MLDFRSGNKSRSFLGEVDGAYLSSPVIEITEQELMDAFVVVLAGEITLEQYLAHVTTGRGER